MNHLDSLYLQIQSVAEVLPVPGPGLNEKAAPLSPKVLGHLLSLPDLPHVDWLAQVEWDRGGRGGMEGLVGEANLIS